MPLNFALLSVHEHVARWGMLVAGFPFLQTCSSIVLMTVQISTGAIGRTAASVPFPGGEEAGGGSHFTEKATDPVPGVGATSAV
jgi:hypothetical protein